MSGALKLDDAVGKVFMDAVHEARARFLDLGKDNALIDVWDVRSGDSATFNANAFNACAFPVWDKSILKILCLCGAGKEIDEGIRAQWDALSQIEKVAYGVDLVFSYRNFVQCVLNATFFTNWRRSQGRPDSSAAN